MDQSEDDQHSSILPQETLFGGRTPPGWGDELAEACYSNLAKNFFPNSTPEDSDQQRPRPTDDNEKDNGNNTLVGGEEAPLDQAAFTELFIQETSKMNTEIMEAWTKQVNERTEETIAQQVQELQEELGDLIANMVLDPAIMQQAAERFCSKEQLQQMRKSSGSLEKAIALVHPENDMSTIPERRSDVSSGLPSFNRVVTSSVKDAPDVEEKEVATPRSAYYTNYSSTTAARSRSRQRSHAQPPSYIDLDEDEGDLESYQEEFEDNDDLLSIYPEFRKNQLCVTLGECQRLCRADGFADRTVVQHRVWADYIKWRSLRGEDVSEWTNFRELPKVDKQPYINERQVNGELWKTYGPFRANLVIEGYTVRDNIFVAKDEHFPWDIALGRSTLAPQVTESLSIRTAQPESEYEESVQPVTANGQHWLYVKGNKVETLLDSGSAASMMPSSIFESLGGKSSLLYDQPLDLRTGNTIPLKCLGITDPISFFYGEVECLHSFIIVDNLPTDSVVLGRDFLIKYDVVIDIPRRNVVIRNPKLEYSIRAIPTIASQKRNIIARLENALTITGGTQVTASCTVHSKRGKIIHRNPWLGIIEPSMQQTRLTQSGVNNAAAIICIDRGRTQIPFLSVGHDIETRRMSETYVARDVTQIPIQRIIYKYERHTPEGIDFEVIRQKGSISTIKLFEINDDGQGSWRGMQQPTKYAAGQPCYLPDNDYNWGEDCNKPFQLLERGQWQNHEDYQPIDYHSPLQEQYYDISGKDKQNEDQPKLKPFPRRPPTSHLYDRLSIDECEEVEAIIDEYSEIFMKLPSEVGQTHLMKHVIETPPDARPVSDPLRRLAPVKKKAADNQVQILIDAGVIRESFSPYGAAIVIAKKKDGAPRFCIDYRKVNDLTKKDVYPLPRIDDCLEKLGGAKWFTSLDMGNAFWQIPLDDEAISKTAFRTPDRKYEWTRMPFGLCNATSTFQRLMSRVLSDICNTVGNLVLCYVDDILIASSSTKDHILRLRQVFRKLRDAGLKLKAGKCELFKTSVKFLGRVVDGDGIRPDPDSIAKVKEWNTPTDKETIAAYLGFANYYREFIKDYAHLAAPLNKLKNKGKQDFEWTPECARAFATLVERLETAPVVSLAHAEGRFILDTCSTDLAIVGVLQQEQMIDGKKELRVISYGSRTLRGPEKHYGYPKLEMLAALTFIENFRTYIEGIKFTLRCDEMAFRWLKTYSTSSNLTARWVQRLEGFKLKLVHTDRRTQPDPYDYVPPRDSKIRTIGIQSVSFMKDRHWNSLTAYESWNERQSREDEQDNWPKDCKINQYRDLGTHTYVSKDEERLVWDMLMCHKPAQSVTMCTPDNATSLAQSYVRAISKLRGRYSSIRRKETAITRRSDLPRNECHQGMDTVDLDEQSTSARQAELPLNNRVRSKSFKKTVKQEEELKFNVVNSITEPPSQERILLRYEPVQRVEQHDLEEVLPIIKPEQSQATVSIHWGNSELATQWDIPTDNVVEIRVDERAITPTSDHFIPPIGKRPPLAKHVKRALHKKIRAFGNKCYALQRRTTDSDMEAMEGPEYVWDLLGNRDYSFELDQDAIVREDKQLERYVESLQFLRKSYPDEMTASQRSRFERVHWLTILSIGTLAARRQRLAEYLTITVVPDFSSGYEEQCRSLIPDRCCSPVIPPPTEHEVRKSTKKTADPIKKQMGNMLSKTSRRTNKMQKTILVRNWLNNNPVEVASQLILLSGWGQPQAAGGELQEVGRKKKVCSPDNGLAGGDHPGNDQDVGRKEKGSPDNGLAGGDHSDDEWAGEVNAIGLTRYQQDIVSNCGSEVIKILPENGWIVLAQIEEESEDEEVELDDECYGPESHFSDDKSVLILDAQDDPTLYDREQGPFLIPPDAENELRIARIEEEEQRKVKRIANPGVRLPSKLTPTAMDRKLMVQRMLRIRQTQKQLILQYMPFLEDDFLPGCKMMVPAKAGVSMLNEVTSFAHTIPADVSMDRGLGNAINFDFRCQNSVFMQECKAGSTAITEITDDKDEFRHFVYHLVTKTRGFDKGTLSYLEACLFEVRDHAIFYGVKEIGMPKLGCAWDGLDWRDVRHALYRIFQESNILLRIYPVMDQ